MVQHPGDRFRPRVRDDTGRVCDVADEEQDAAYLEHENHSEPVIRFFVRTSGAVPPLELNGVIRARLLAFGTQNLFRKTESA